MGEEFEDFVPDLSTAGPLLADLGRSGVARAERYALLGVSGISVVRRSWTDSVELVEAEYREILDTPAPKPDLEAPAVRHHRVVDEASLAAVATPCGSCWAAPGKVFCARCGGPSRIHASTGCDHCGGSGHTDCTTCEGTGKTLKVELIFAEDRVTPFAHVFVPEAPYALAVKLSRFLQQRSRLPDCLRFELGDDHAQVDAYRGRRGQEEYRGQQLGDALARGRHYVERLNAVPSVRAMRVTAHVWPFARLELENGSIVALAVDEDRRPRILLPGA